MQENENQHPNEKETERTVIKMNTKIHMKKNMNKNENQNLHEKNDKHNERKQELSNIWKKTPIFLHKFPFFHVFSLQRALNFGAPWSWGSVELLSCGVQMFFFRSARWFQDGSSILLPMVAGSLHIPWQIFWDGFRLLADGACGRHRWRCWSRWWSSEHLGNHRGGRVYLPLAAAIKGDWWHNSQVLQS